MALDAMLCVVNKPTTLIVVAPRKDVIFYLDRKQE
jgi:hypothetical protein